MEFRLKLSEILRSIHTALTLMHLLPMPLSHLKVPKINCEQRPIHTVWQRISQSGLCVAPPYEDMCSDFIMSVILMQFSDKIVKK